MARIFSQTLLLLLSLLIVLVTSADAAGLRGEGERRLADASLADAQPLRLHFTVKRPSMAVYGQTEFDVFANPIVSSDNTSVSYNGFASFLVDTTFYKFLLVDGIAYYVEQVFGDGGTSTETAQCLASSVLPPLNSIVNVLDAAVPISGAVLSDDDSKVNCTTGNLFKTTFAGSQYVLCAAGSDGFTLYGSDLDISVDYLANPVPLTAPTLDATAALTCETVISATTVTSETTAALLTGTAISESTRRALKAEADATVAASTCSCKSTARPCIFFHGLGSETETGLQTTSDYFGDISGSAPCCSSIKYAVLNTVDYAWTSTTLQQKVCNYAISMSSTSSASTKTIANTIIVTHSMGGLMMGGAIANGLCKLASTSSWVSLSAPMTGSMGSDYLQDACSGVSNGFITAVANLIGECPANTATVSLAYQSESYSTSTLNAAYTAAQTAFRTYVSAAMCSNDYSGLLSTDQVVYKLAGSVIPHKSSQNDGIVEYQSCAGGLATSKFGSTYSSTFYVTGLNHADTAFLHGDALIKDSQKPVKWFECLL
jgi:hypothetical protein